AARLGGAGLGCAEHTSRDAVEALALAAGEDGDGEVVVGRAVAVVVDPVADLGARGRGHAGDGRAARACGRGVRARAFAAREVGDGVVDDAVAVVVLAVAGLEAGGAGHAGLGYAADAVRHGARALALAAREDGEVLVGHAVAVVVFAVADLDA